jgi:CBS domain-containing protein
VIDLAATVAQVMTGRVCHAKDTISVFEASRIMAKEKISSLVLLRGKNVSGIVTEKDFLEKVIVSGKDPKATLVGEIMTKKIVTIPDDAQLDDAARLMRDKRIKKLVVVGKDKALLGILTSFDLVVAQPALRIISDPQL